MSDAIGPTLMGDHLRRAAIGKTVPETHIRGGRNARFKCIGPTVNAVQRAGFARIAFVLEPRGSHS